MPFTLPQFNCTFTLYRFGGPFPSWEKLGDLLPCQWYVNPRFVVYSTPAFGGEEEILLGYLRVPKTQTLEEGDIVRVDPGADFAYEILEVERVHLNFPNEYRVGYTNNLDVFTLPFGPLLDEGSDEAILTETANPITTENI